MTSHKPGPGHPWRRSLERRRREGTAVPRGYTVPGRSVNLSVRGPQTVRTKRGRMSPREEYLRYARRCHLIVGARIDTRWYRSGFQSEASASKAQTLKNCTEEEAEWYLDEVRRELQG